MEATSAPARPEPSRTDRRPRRLVTVVALLTLLLVGLPAAGQPASALQDGTVDYTGTGALVLGAESVNVRDCAGFDCDMLGTLTVGERVVIAGPEENGFLPVDAESGALSGYAYALYISIDGLPAPWLQEGSAGCDRVALAFNIGVGQPFDYGILETLREWEVPATFFAMGWTTDREPETVQAIVDAGFPIGTHGYSSLDLPTTSDYDIVADLQASAESIRAVAGDNWIPYHTPFAASTDERVRTLISAEGFLPVGWRISAADYAADADPDAIWERVVPNIYDGAIVEMHIDAPNSAASTGVALPWIIEALLARDYQFVTIPDMALPCGVTTSDLDGGPATPAVTTPGASGARTDPGETAAG